MRSLTNYTSLCALNSEHGIYIFIMHSFCGISTPLNIFCAYLIVYHSPKFMREYKWYLLTYHTFTSIADIAATFLVIPIGFFPLPMINTVGLLHYTSIPTMWQMMISVGLGFLSICSTLVLFFHRLQQIVPKGHFMHVGTCGRKVFICLVHSLAIGCVLGLGCTFQFLLNSQDVVKTRVFKELPCLTNIITMDSFYILDLTADAGLVFTILTSFIVIVLSSAFIGFIGLSYFYLRKATKGNLKISEKTRNMQRKLMTHLLFQILLPFMVLFAPLIASMVVLRYFMQNTQFMSNIMFLSVGVHGSISSISIILFNSSYLTKVKQSLLFKRDSSRDTSRMPY